MSTIITVLNIQMDRRAWTGGDKPHVDFPDTPLAKALYKAYLDEQIAECGGLDLWACAGTSADERLEIFKGRALFDAWRTLNP